MSIKPKQYKVSIFNEVYSFVSDEPEEHLIKAAQQLDLGMKELAEKTSLIDPKRLAILVALRVASRLSMLESHMKQCQEENQRLIDQIDREISAFASSSMSL
jgi:cell division protein ZapA (FtsZ GTPase activity inhibitor)